MTLRAEYEVLLASCGHNRADDCGRALALGQRLAAALEAAERDAARYRWLRRFQRIEITLGEIVDMYFDPEDDSGSANDTAIDAAIKERT